MNTTAIPLTFVLNKPKDPRLETLEKERLNLAPGSEHTCERADSSPRLEKCPSSLPENET